MIIPAMEQYCGPDAPWIEIVAGVFLIIRIQVRPCASYHGMLGVFLGAIIYAYSIGLDIDCGCFSSAATSGGRIGLIHIARDATLFLISLFILVSDRGNFSASRMFARSVPTP
jgi:hypothetical protein